MIDLQIFKEIMKIYKIMNHEDLLLSKQILINYRDSLTYELNHEKMIELKKMKVRAMAKQESTQEDRLMITSNQVTPFISVVKSFQNAPDTLNFSPGTITKMMAARSNLKGIDRIESEINKKVNLKRNEIKKIISEKKRIENQVGIISSATIVYTFFEKEGIHPNEISNLDAVELFKRFSTNGGE